MSDEKAKGDEIITWDGQMWIGKEGGEEMLLLKASGGIVSISERVFRRRKRLSSLTVRRTIVRLAERRVLSVYIARRLDRTLRVGVGRGIGLLGGCRTDGVVAGRRSTVAGGRRVLRMVAVRGKRRHLVVVRRLVRSLLVGLRVVDDLHL